MQLTPLFLAALTSALNTGLGQRGENSLRALDPSPSSLPTASSSSTLHGSTRASTLSKRADYQNAPGVANGQCAQSFSDFGCGSQNSKAQYKPTCAGNCYVDSFNSVSVASDGTYGTDCVLYSDSSCQNKVGDTGNHVVGGAACTSVIGNSIKFYYRC